MLQTLFISVTLAITVSALCSVCEAVLYSITASQVEMLKKEGGRSGELLQAMRADIEEPITAILTLNTIANTIGAAVAGAAAATIFGDENLLFFSLCFTLAILIFSEILPKTVGVTFAFKLAPAISYPLRTMIIVLKPIVWLCRVITRILPQRQEETISAEEVRTLATMSRQSGDLAVEEEQVISNIIELKSKIVRQVMTPRTVTFSMNEHYTVEKAMEMLTQLSSHSRIPIYNREPNSVTGIILRKDILQAAAEDKHKHTLSRFKRPAHFVPETAPLNQILIDFFERRQHLFIVVDEYGTMTGIISMEDVIEEIVGREIIDESDEQKDMRELARSKTRNTRLSMQQKYGKSSGEAKR
ncbi:hemolysin family protein [Desulforhopalus singaporensis]|uniref:Hemolysin, contains CBS domains n=1 Tax=Desulforhopalus singaporensis TaxID=91360 RepID=A0A1H0PTG5_9BACT|nr:hemolysin family protein [Desulforhopalus singaporensis]SDP08457.1 Hemolysin, contains CBS domains [Desulforhopalus singaporensis]